MRKIFQSKLNIVLIVSYAIGLIAAQLTHFWRFCMYISVFALSVGLFSTALFLIKKHNELKRYLIDQLSELKPSKIHYIKQQLLGFKLLIAMFLAVSILILIKFISDNF